MDYAAEAFADSDELARQELEDYDREYEKAEQLERQVQEQLEKQMTEWNEIAHSKLAATREARKRAEVDANLLANRIALLKAEEAKTWKVIEATNRKTQEILKTKQKREAELEAKEAYKRQQQEKVEEQRRVNEENRVRARAARIDAKATLQAAHYAKAQKGRSELKARERSLEQRRMGELEQNQQMSKARLPMQSFRARSESPRHRELQRAGSSCSSNGNPTCLENEEKDLLRRMHFSATASKYRPPRAELGYAPLIQENQLRPSFVERTRCAALANARGQFEPEPQLAFVEFQNLDRSHSRG